MTARAVCVGLFCALLINLAMPYNDHYLYNTLLIGNHLPVITIVLMMLLILGVNAWLAPRLKFDPLAPGELLLIWGIIGVSGGICSAGIMRYLPTWLVVPAYYNTPQYEYGVYFLKYLPDWLLVSRDPENLAVKWYMEGLPGGERIPWGEWLLPMGVWIVYMILMYAANFALIAMFFRQWSVRERLVFPVIQLPLLLAEAPQGKSRLNSFLSNRLTWMGAAIPIAIWGINSLHSYVSWVPAIPTTFSLWNLFPDRPWNELHLHDAKLFFTIIGISFLLTKEASLSLWFFYVFYRLSFVFVAWIGAGGTGYWGQWTTRVDIFQHAGALIALAAFLFWTARGFLKGWWGRVLTGKTEPELDPLPPRLSLILLAVGIPGMIGWVMLSGSQWWVAALMVVFFMITVLVLTRIIAEAGLIFVHASAVTYDFIVGIFPAGWFSGFSLSAMTMQRGMLQDLREILLPYVANGTKAAETAGLRAGKVLAVFALAAGLSLVSSAYSRIVTGYKYGALNMDSWATYMSVDWYLPAVTKFQKTPPNYELTGPADTKFLPVNLAHLLTGGGITALLLFLRAQFIWWPLHPFGFVMAPTWCLMNMWFSFFLGWAAKAGVMTFGGATVFRKLLPFFLGMVLGESLMAGLWIVIGLITGTPGFPILPG